MVPPSSPRQADLSSLDTVAALLREAYEDFAHHNREEPLEELIFIICSIMTQEVKYLKVFEKLQQAFPNVGSLARATDESVAEVLEWGGLGPKKAEIIKNALGAIQSEFGSLTLEPLRTMRDEDAEEFLTSLPGIGKKMARCVMLYALGKAVFPVDTHCWRICRRLGWIRSERDWCTSAEMDLLQELIPSELRFSLHVNLLSHGRKVCTAFNPSCGVCLLSDHCLKIGVSQDDGIAA